LRVDHHYDGREVAPGNTEGPIPLGASDDMIWFARGRVMVCLANNAVGGRPEAMSRVRERHRQLGAPLALSIIVKEGMERPNDEMREEIRQAFDEISPLLACNAITILGSGFFAGFFISIVSQTLQLVRKTGGRYRIHTSLESAAAWMHEQLDDPGTTVEGVLETLQWAAGERQAPAGGARDN
jgi:hypothetical protein